MIAPAHILSRNCYAVEFPFGVPEHVILDMREIMKGKGIGIAAPQVGIPYSFFVTQEQVFINPRIKAYSKEKALLVEGCLSIPGVRLPIERAVEIDVYYLDEKGEPHNETLKGLSARVFQHETDHLSGRLIPQVFADMFNFHA